MAWSDAARAAALAARRTHLGYRAQFSSLKTTRFISAPTNKAGRKSIAQQIRRLRREPAYSEITLHEVMSNAVASTKLRNARRIMRRKK